MSDVQVEPDPRRGAGHARIRVDGILPGGGPLRFRIRRTDFATGTLGPDGWQVAEALLEPMTVEPDGDATVLIVGPAVCDVMEEGVVEFSIPAAGISQSVYWPDIAPLHGGSYRNLGVGVRRGNTSMGGPRGLSPSRVAAAEETVRMSRPVPLPEEIGPAELQQDAKGAPAAPVEPPVSAESEHKRSWLAPLLVIALLVLVGAAGGGYAWWRWWHSPVPPPTPPVSTPTPAPPTPAEPTVDLAHMSVRDLVARGNPAEMMEEAERRRKAGNLNDALTLMHEAADRNHTPALVALATYYDPLVQHEAGVRPNAREAARYYLQAERAGDTSTKDAREALRASLATKAAGNPTSDEALILKDFWP